MTRSIFSLISYFPDLSSGILDGSLGGSQHNEEMAL